MAAGHRKKRHVNFTPVIEGLRFPEGLTIEGVLGTPLMLETSVENRAVPKKVQAALWLGLFMAGFFSSESKVPLVLMALLTVVVLAQYARSVSSASLRLPRNTRFMDDSKTGYERLWQLASLVFALMVNKTFQTLDPGLQANFYDDVLDRHMEAINGEYFINALNTIHAQWVKTAVAPRDMRIVDAEIARFSCMVRAAREKAGFAVAAIHFAAPIGDSAMDACCSRQ